MSRVVVGIVVVVSLLVGAGSAAHADKAASLEHHRRGKAAYDAGRFEEAAAAFEAAHREHPAPEYLYNLGRARRETRPCDAIEVFKRYLASAPPATVRRKVERWLASDGAKCPGATPAAAAAPPASVAPRPAAPAVTVPPPAPAAPAAQTAPTPTPTPSAVRVVPASVASTAPSGGELGVVGVYAQPGTRLALALAVSVGVERWSMGPVDMPVVPSVAVLGLHALGGRWSVGARASWSSIAYDDLDQGRAHVASLGAVGALTTGERVRFGAHVELGASAWWGIGEGNPFTEDDGPIGARLVPRVAGSLELEVPVTPTLALRVEPLALAWSPPPDGFAPDIDALFVVSASIGVAWRP